MRIRSFKVPPDEEMARAFGASPVLLDRDGLKVVSIDDAVTGDRIELTYEPVTSSVRYQWLRRGEPFVDIYREGVTEMRIVGERHETLEVLFRFDGAAGRVALRLVPFVAVDDATVGA